jgi:hypothetical protein
MKILNYFQLIDSVLDRTEPNFLQTKSEPNPNSLLSSVRFEIYLKFDSFTVLHLNTKIRKNIEILKKFGFGFGSFRFIRKNSRVSLYLLRLFVIQNNCFVAL